MIWACSRCRRPCLEVYPKEDKTIVYQGHCKECYYIIKEERISLLARDGFLSREESNINITQNNTPQIEESNINITQNNTPQIETNLEPKQKYLPVIVFPTVLQL